MMIDDSPTRQLSAEIGTDDVLWRHVKTVPAFRALLRAVESRFYRLVDLPHPVLDLGCGDGHFAQLTFSEPLEVGIDPWWGPLVKARRAGSHQFLLSGAGDALPFPDDYFGAVISNSVLEHIGDVDRVLVELNRVLRSDGVVMITMPSHLFTRWLGGATLFEKAGVPVLANLYRKSFNFVARHVHTDAPSVWASRLANAGFVIDRWQYYFSKRALWALEWGHVQGLPSALLHALTGHWILAPWKSNLARTERWIRPFYDEIEADFGAYVLFVARKVDSAAIEAFLPAARPFTAAQLSAAGSEERGLIPEFHTVVPDKASSPATADQDASQPDQMDSAGEQQFDVTDMFAAAGRTLPQYVTAALFILSLGSAAVGQMILTSHSSNPAGGLKWYGLAISFLILLLWRTSPAHLPRWPGFRVPSFWSVKRRRWGIILSFSLVLLAYGISGASGGSARPSLAITLWLAAIIAALYAMDRTPELRSKSGFSRFTVIAAISLFLVALVVRTVNLTGKPFILNGVESSIGLDALNVANGYPISPFSTGWLTNPTLIYYVISIPLKLLGPTVLGIRLLSPFVGAVTVALLFYFGRALWGNAVGLVAATLLAGSHLHLHYSRMGMTNIWDPLLILTALGFTAIAWKSTDQVNQRRTWLAAGGAIGLSAYLFTSSRLLPPMLICLLGSAVVLNRDGIRRRWRNLLAAALLALVISLPQLLFYLNNPGTFWDRANNLGIAAGQSGWIVQEAARSQKSQLTVLGDQLLRSLLSFNYELDNSPAYRPPVPLLSFGPSMLFVLGAVMLLWRIRHLRSIMLLTWVGVTILFAGAMLVETPSSHRLLIAAPALSLIGAIALTKLGELAVEVIGHRQEAGVAAGVPARIRSSYLLPSLLFISALFSLYDMMFYFRGYHDEMTFADRNTEVAFRIAGYLNTLDEDVTAYFHGPPAMYIGFPTIPFLARDFQSGLNLFDVMEPDADFQPAFTSKSVHLILPERFQELGPLQERYPEGHVLEFAGSYAKPLFFAFEVNNE